MTAVGTVHGLLLAAGAGSRMGTPKALVRDAAGEPWLLRGAETLLEGGCDEVTVVLGAAVEDALPLLEGTGVDVVVAHDWATGMGASLRAGLAALPTGAAAALVHLVDLPDVGPDVVARVIGSGTPDGLVRAAYNGVPGHPVLIGRDHWSGVRETARGDQGARRYLATHPTVLVECGDLASGADVDSLAC